MSQIHDTFRGDDNEDNDGLGQLSEDKKLFYQINKKDTLSKN